MFIIDNKRSCQHIKTSNRAAWVFALLLWRIVYGESVTYPTDSPLTALRLSLCTKGD